MAPRTSTSSQTQTQTQTRTETLNPKPDITATRFTTKPPKPKPPVCFSFAAYSKAVIHHLTSLNIPILPGLTDQEIASVESAFFFTFPPDLRAILQVGLPVGSHFPNWRSSSPQQLHILLSLPVLNLSKNISCNGFWSDSWGPKPGNEDDALSLIKLLWQNAPVLVPIYKNCYIPSTRPNIAGNPVFYIDSDDVRVLSFDLAGFFQRFDSFLQVGGFEYHKALGRRGLDKVANVPAWAAKVPRRIDFWTEVAERGRRMVPRADTRGWWCGNNECLELRTCLEEVFWRLRDGGWREEEVKEMMMVDGCDDGDRRRSGAQSVDMTRRNT